MHAAPVYAQEVGIGTDGECKVVVVVVRADDVLFLAELSECDEFDGDRDCLVGRAGAGVKGNGSDVHESVGVDVDLGMEGATSIVGCAGGTDLGDGRFSVSLCHLRRVGGVEVRSG